MCLYVVCANVCLDKSYMIYVVPVYRILIHQRSLPNTARDCQTDEKLTNLALLSKNSLVRLEGENYQPCEAQYINNNYHIYDSSENVGN